MKQEDLKLALQMVGVDIDSAALDLFIQTYEQFKLTGESFSLRDAAKIKCDVRAKNGRGKRMYISFEI